jgi:hypothetical protein
LWSFDEHVEGGSEGKSIVAVAILLVCSRLTRVCSRLTRPRPFYRRGKFAISSVSDTCDAVLSMVQVRYVSNWWSLLLLLGEASTYSRLRIINI